VLVEGEPEGTEVLGDSSYGTGELRHHLADQDMTAVIKPPPLLPAVESGYTLDDFDINETAGTVTCPARLTVHVTARRRARFAATAPPAGCGPAAPRPPAGGSSGCTPTTPARRRPRPGRHRRVQQHIPAPSTVLGPVKEGRLYGTKATCAAGSTLNTGSSVGHDPRTTPTLRTRRTQRIAQRAPRSAGRL
jgi:hypothetical protein